jgi:hypothetical protein
VLWERELKCNILKRRGCVLVAVLHIFWSKTNYLIDIWLTQYQTDLSTSQLLRWPCPKLCHYNASWQNDMVTAVWNKNFISQNAFWPNVFQPKAVELRLKEGTVYSLECCQEQYCAVQYLECNHIITFYVVLKKIRQILFH